MIIILFLLQPLEDRAEVWFLWELKSSREKGGWYVNKSKEKKKKKKNWKGLAVVQRRLVDEDKTTIKTSSLC